MKNPDERSGIRKLNLWLAGRNQMNNLEKSSISSLVWKLHVCKRYSQNPEWWPAVEYFQWIPIDCVAIQSNTNTNQIGKARDWTRWIHCSPIHHVRKICKSIQMRKTQQLMCLSVRWDSKHARTCKKKWRKYLKMKNNENYAKENRKYEDIFMVTELIAFEKPAVCWKSKWYSTKSGWTLWPHRFHWSRSPI